jgi:hypothetical protein
MQNFISKLDNINVTVLDSTNAHSFLLGFSKKINFLHFLQNFIIFFTLFNIFLEIYKTNLRMRKNFLLQQSIELLYII